MPNVSFRQRRRTNLVALTISAGVFVAACSSDDRPPALVVGSPVVSPMPAFQPDPDEAEAVNDGQRRGDGGGTDGGEDGGAPTCTCAGCPFTVTFGGATMSGVLPCGYSICSGTVKQTCTVTCRTKRTSC